MFNVQEYNQWLENHKCRINHTMSSGAMESSGAIELFRRSVDSKGLVYKEYLGDGDTSSFKNKGIKSAIQFLKKEK